MRIALLFEAVLDGSGGSGLAPQTGFTTYSFEPTMSRKPAIFVSAWNCKGLLVERETRALKERC